jgi:enamine deaminase RidA (YjgF/YER057c/UK114 family)
MYSKAGLIFISGMVGWDENGNIPDIGDPAAQARRAFENLKDVLAEVGGTLDDVVMETEYVVDMVHYKEIGRIRNEYFLTNRPAATLVEVRRLFKPELLFEIQAIAVAR